MKPNFRRIKAFIIYFIAFGFLIACNNINKEGNSSNIYIDSNNEDSLDHILEKEVGCEFTNHEMLKSGENIAVVLQRHRINSYQIAAVSKELNRQTKLTSLPIGTHIDMRLSDSGIVNLRLTPPKSAYAFYANRVDNQSFKAITDTLLTDTIPSRFEGTVESTLYEAFIDGGANPTIAVNYIEVYQFVHYFSSETRVGDKYRMIIDRVMREGVDIGYGRVRAAQYISGTDTLTAVWRPDSDSEFGGEYFDEIGDSYRRDLLRAPFPAARLTSTFGLRRHPISKKIKKHYGVDFGAKTGTPIVAAGNGVVTKAIKGNTGLGNWLHIKHGDTGFETRYGHLKSFAKGVRRGVTVKQGQTIGYVGQTGYATGPHLHYETWRDGNRFNPLKAKGSPIKKLPEEELNEFMEKCYVPWRNHLEDPDFLDVVNGYSGPQKLKNKNHVSDI